MKVLGTILLALLLWNNTWAQKVIVQESEEKTEGTRRKGLFIVLEIDEDVVKSAWVKKLREYGSLKTRQGSYIVEEGNVPSLSMTNVKVISKIETTQKGTRVWYSLDLGDSYVTSSGDQAKYKQAEKLLHDFGVGLYIQDINEQIRDAEKVLATSVKDQEKMIYKGENIKGSIGRNRLEKVKLDQKILENIAEYKLLLVDSVQNYKNQLGAQETVDKMKRSVEAVRAKISKIE